MTIGIRIHAKNPVFVRRKFMTFPTPFNQTAGVFKFIHFYDSMGIFYFFSVNDCPEGDNIIFL